MKLPSQINFESLAKQFMSLAAERYPTEAKVLQTATKLGIDKDIRSQIIVFSQFRDAVREVDFLRIFKSTEHRNELYKAIITALEGLEDQYDDLLDQQAEEEEEAPIKD